VFRGDDGLDELTTTTTSRVWAVTGGAVTELVVEPGDVGLPRSAASDLRGGDAAYNADVVRRVVGGERGPVRDAVVLNAGAALAVYDGSAAEPLERLRAGVGRAEEAIDSGGARDVLERWVRVSAEVS